jgi:hypothetical protein
VIEIPISGDQRFANGQFHPRDPLAENITPWAIAHYFPEKPWHDACEPFRRPSPQRYLRCPMTLRFSQMPLVRSLSGPAAIVGSVVALTTMILRGGQANDSGAGAPIKTEAHKALVDYFRAAQPGDNAEIFAPGIVS